MAEEIAVGIEPLDSKKLVSDILDNNRSISTDVLEEKMIEKGCNDASKEIVRLTKDCFIIRQSSKVYNAIAVNFDDIQQTIVDIQTALKDSGSKWISKANRSKTKLDEIRQAADSSWHTRQRKNLTQLKQDLCGHIKKLHALQDEIESLQHGINSELSGRINEVRRHGFAVESLTGKSIKIPSIDWEVHGYSSVDKALVDAEERIDKELFQEFSNEDFVDQYKKIFESKDAVDEVDPKLRDILEERDIVVVKFHLSEQILASLSDYEDSDEDSDEDSSGEEDDNA